MIRLAILQTIAQEKLNLATTEAHRQVWTDYLTELSAWVLVDPINPIFPRIPVITQDGSVLQVTASGAEPNVIG
jgi:hypothetical protein